MNLNAKISETWTQDRTVLAKEAGQRRTHQEAGDGKRQPSHTGWVHSKTLPCTHTAAFCVL